MTKFRSRKMSAYDQFQLLRLSEPMLPAVLSMFSRGREIGLSQLPSTLFTIASTSDVDSDALFDFCVSWAEASDDDLAWAPVQADDLEFSELMALVVSVVYDNLSSYLAHKPFKAEGASAYDAVVYKPATLPDKSDWFWGPLDDHMCRYESLVDGTLSLLDVARMNDVISVREENQSRAANAAANAKR